MATTPSPSEFLQAHRPKATAAPKAKTVSSRSRERPFPKLCCQVICVSPLETGGGADRERVKVRAVDRKRRSSETQSQRQQRVSCRQKKKPHRRGLWGLRSVLSTDPTRIGNAVPLSVVDAEKRQLAQGLVVLHPFGDRRNTQHPPNLLVYELEERLVAERRSGQVDRDDASRIRGDL